MTGNSVVTIMLSGRKEIPESEQKEMRALLSRPVHGWTLFRLGDLKYCYELSYLTDVPVEWLDAAIGGLEKMCEFSVDGELEPGTVVCTVGLHECRVTVTTRPGCPVYRQPIGMLGFCRELHADISGCLEDWVNWDSGALRLDASEYDEDEAEWVFHPERMEDVRRERRNDLQQRLDRLSDLIRMREANFQQ